jgi:uncharacterized protein (TIGR00725 family)
MQIVVIGAAICGLRVSAIAERVGFLLAKEGAILICGGLGGVMEAAARGAKNAGGTTIGILPGFSASEANDYIDVKIVTGLGHACNVLVVRSADAIIAISGGYGTLSEIALALKMGVPVIGLDTWELEENLIEVARDPEDAVQKAINVAIGGFI